MSTDKQFILVLAIICMCEISSGLPTIETESVIFSQNSIHEEQSAGYIITAGGTTGTRYLQNAYVYDLTSGVWSRLPDLQFPSYWLAMVANRGQVFAIGGVQDGNYSNTTYYLSTGDDNAWVHSSPVTNTYRSRAEGSTQAVSLNGSIYLYGFTDDMSALVVQGCDGIWSNLPRSKRPHVQGSAAVLNGNIYVCGGPNIEDPCEVYDPASKIWTTLPPMKIPRDHPAIVGLNGFLYVIGGADGLNERFDPSTSKWTFFKSTITHPLYGTVAVTDRENIYVIGGYANATTVDSIQMYRTDLDIWQTISNYHFAAQCIGAVFVERMPIN